MKKASNHISSILIIDTDEEDRWFFKGAIAAVSSRIAVNFCSDTKEILEVLERKRPDLIFIEYKLPLENGVERVQRLKSHQVFCTIPVIMWSTGSEVSIIEAAYKAGVHYYQEKPWQLTEWNLNVKKILQQIWPIPAISVSCQQKVPYPA